MIIKINQFQQICFSRCYLGFWGLELEEWIIKIKHGMAAAVKEVCNSRCGKEMVSDVVHYSEWG